MTSFVFPRAVWDALQSAQLSDRDTLGLLKGIMHHAFGGPEPPEIGKTARAMLFLIGQMVSNAPQDAADSGASAGLFPKTQAAPEAAVSEENSM